MLPGCRHQKGHDRNLEEILSSALERSLACAVLPLKASDINRVFRV